MVSGVFFGGKAFVPSDAGIVHCLEPRTGATVWQERLQVPSKRAASWSSMVLSGERIYLPTQGSDTVVLRAAPKFEQLAVNYVPVFRVLRGTPLDRQVAVSPQHS